MKMIQVPQSAQALEAFPTAVHLVPVDRIVAIYTENDEEFRIVLDHPTQHMYLITKITGAQLRLVLGSAGILA